MTRAHGRPLYRAAFGARYAIPAFNVSNLETAQAVLAAATAAAAPVVLQVSPGAIAYAGYRPLTRLVMDLADEAEVPVIVHLDHCRDPVLVRQALEDGYGSVMFDGSARPLEENVELTAALVAAARARGPGVAFEAELGRIGGREDTDLETAWAERTTPTEAAAFVTATDTDLLAPNLGNLHRMPDDSSRLDVDQVRAIAETTRRPVVLHGGSGVDRAQLQAAIAAGIAKINISSRVGRALAAGIREAWAERPDETDLRRFLGKGREAVAAMATDYFSLTGAAGRAAAEGRAAAAAVARPVFAGDIEAEPE
ncbi:MAG: ketose-bisphosphate aldolase [Chloroflexi bacterium]|nr:ketose-bisphosphate aldolase [Chloroflexota bacterium]